MRFSMTRLWRTTWLIAVGAAVVACGRHIEHEASEVNHALDALDAGDAGGAALQLSQYLATGVCEDGNIGTPERVQQRRWATFDLSLALFRIGEAFGGPFGSEESDAGGEAVLALRRKEVACALRLLRAIADRSETPVELRARAHYLEGNLLLLNGENDEAVKAYDQALSLAPGAWDAGDPIGRDAAWNRAIALARHERKQDAGNDGGSDGGDAGDSGSDGGDSGGDDAGKDGGNGQDGGQDGGGQDGGAQDGGSPPPPQPDPKDNKAPPPTADRQTDESALDKLERAPTVQQESARKQRKRVRGAEDK
jgi:tetratricopeptide (TPR) repeat protein